MGAHKQNGADPKALKFNKVHMGTHRRSGLLISKELCKSSLDINKLCGGDSTKSISMKSRFLSHSLAGRFDKIDFLEISTFKLLPNS